MKLKAYKVNINKKNILLIIGFIVLLIGYIKILMLLNYKCIIHEMFGIYCPGCGGTRMIISFIHLDFYQAFRWNPLLFILLIIGIIYLIIDIIVYFRKKVILVPNLKVWIGLVIILVIYMIIRNIDIFSYLIPTKV